MWPGLGSLDLPALGCDSFQQAVSEVRAWGGNGWGSTGRGRSWGRGLGKEAGVGVRKGKAEGHSMYFGKLSNRDTGGMEMFFL